MSIMPQSPTELTIDHIRQALSTDIDEPKSTKWIAARLPKRMNVTSQDISALLASTALPEGIHVFPLKRENRYWHASPEEYVRQKLVEKARTGPRTKADLCGAVAKLGALCGLISRKAVEQLFSQLIREQVIQTCPAVIGGRSKLYVVGQPMPTFYVRDVITKLKHRLGLTFDEVAKAFRSIQGDADRCITASAGTPAQLSVGTPADHLPDTPADERILISLRELEPRFDEGMLVSLPMLREKLELSFPSHESFDEAVLNLVDRRVLSIHPYDHPLTEEQRAAFVRDERGTWYNVVSKRH